MRAMVILLLGMVLLMPLKLTRASATLGVSNGALAPCPGTPNCVSSQATDVEYRVAPFNYTGSTIDAKARVKQVVAAMPRTRLIAETENYLHFEFTSLLLRFVDDVEFYIDDKSRRIHIRSASRLGRYDFGVNRKRVEVIRRAFEVAAEPAAP